MNSPSPKRTAALIVEDDPLLRATIVDLLREIDLDTIECESAEAALAMLLTRGSEIAVILSDIRLTGVMDGLDFAREAKQRRPHIPFVLMSGNLGERARLLPPGVVFIPKPWQPTHILEIARLAQSSSAQRSAFGR